MPSDIAYLQPLPLVGASNLLEYVTCKRGLSDLVLSPATRAGLERVLLENRAFDTLSPMGLRPANRLLFCGPPGCGKTAAAGAVALELGMPLVSARLDAVIASHLGETAGHLRRVFDFAKPPSKIVLFLDEVDALGRSRDDKSSTDLGEMKRVVNSLLVMLEEIVGPSLVIAATNHEGVLDPALWRRFDGILVFPRPTGAEAATLLRRTIGKFRPLDAVVGSRWTRQLSGMSFADVERVALDVVKTRTLQSDVSIERALGVALARQTGRRALTAGAKRRPRRSAKR